MIPGRCPLTGETSELIQWVSPRLLRGLWRASFGVEPTPLPETRIGLWRSPVNLAFFAPVFEGDGAFYAAFYRYLERAYRLSQVSAGRPEYPLALSHIRPGEAVLEVGAGMGTFGRLLPRGVRYKGLDPYAAAYGAPPELVSSEALSAQQDCYDIVAAFHVIEHVADPLGFAQAMAGRLRPGGRLILAAPNWPSLMTAIPNFVLNAPPHHLSWWSERAMATLAARVGLDIVDLHLVPPAREHPLIYWMARLAPIKAPPSGPFFRARKSWYVALAVAWLCGWLAARLLPLPRNAPPMSVLLVARKP